MARRKKGRAISGIVLVDKSQGSSSNHILQRVRAIYGAEKAGHTGALDPLATGMLPVCLGEATKFSQYLLNSDKTYVVTAKFGQRTDTSDADGEVVETHDVNITEQQILEFKKTLTGPIKQIPTMFSALKHNGQPLYKLARQGITVEREARPITVYSFELLRFEGDEADFEIHCSKGTYIRTLVDDLGQMLGCGAHVQALRRTKVANYPIEKMLTVDQIQQLKDDNFIDGDESNGVDFTVLDSHLLPMDTALEGLTRIEVTADEVKTLRHGQFPARQMPDEEDLKAYQIETGEFIGVVSIRGGEIRTKRLVVTENFI